MVEQILRSMVFGGPYTYNSKKYTLTENNPGGLRRALSLKDTDRNLSLKEHREWVDGGLAPSAHREKVYWSDGTIFRCSADYQSLMPKNSSGEFEISDHGMYIKGELKKGKISNMTLVNDGKAKRYLLSDISDSNTRFNIERLLKSAEDGTRELQNLTKVILKKYLAFLLK